MRGAHFPKLSVGDSLVQQFADARENGLEIVLDQLVEMRRLPVARPHHLALHQLGIHLVGGDEIEISGHVSQNLLARRQFTVEHAEHVHLERPKRFIQHCPVKRFFVFEVVINQSFVDARLARNGIRPRPRDAMLGKLLRRGRQNGSSALLRLPPRPHAAEVMTVLRMMSK
jgi:hypothetical protein